MQLPPYFSSLNALSALEEVLVLCRAGYRLDKSEEGVIIAGLELLGPVLMLHFSIFPEPDPAVTSVLSMADLLDSATITMQPCAWTSCRGPVYVSVFNLKALLHRTTHRASADCRREKTWSLLH